MKKQVATIATAAILTSTFSTTVFADDTYKVQSGDTLTHIAKKYNTTVTNLKLWNALKSDLIFVNQKLTVTAPASTNSTKTTTTENKTSSSVGTTKGTSSMTASKAKTYTVVSGDSLIKIANKHGISLGELKSWNKLDSHLIYPGQVFVVSQPGTVVSDSKENGSTSGTGTSTSADKVSSGTVGNVASDEYMVKIGDSLSKIAVRHGVTVGQLKTWNLLRSDLIFPNQKLKVADPTVSENSSAVPATPVSTPPASTTPSVPAKPVTSVPATPSTTEDAPSTQYVIKSGDTLGKIAREFGLTVEKLKEINNRTSDLIFPGQKLIVSVASGGAGGSQVDSGDGTTSDYSALISKAAVNEAKKLLGIPYVFGGSSVAGFDCSGFIYYVLNQAGLSMKRLSSDGYYDRSFYVDEPQVGDFVFFENTYRAGISHLGIYLGNNEFIHADAGGVRISSLTGYWKDHFESFKRIY